jgi:UPF0755 protein
MTEINLHKEPVLPKSGGFFKKALIGLVVLGVAAGAVYLYYFKTNVPEDLQNEYVKIPTGSDMDDLVKQLDTEGVILDADNFKQWASWLDFKNVRAGRFKITKGWSSYDLVKHLQRAEQSPVKIVLNNERTPAQVAGKIAKVFERDSLAFLTAFQDKNLIDSLGLKYETLMCVFLPNTYSFMWNTEPRKFLERMATEYKKYWNAERTAKAKVQGLTPDQAVTMASIVEGESKYDDEKKRVAGAYLNRLKRNMRLQADPTVQFALMEIENAKSFRRLMNRDYLTPHPYNTYMNDGLPPGPVCMPAPTSIEAVLSPEEHNFVYFCAKPDMAGYHNFAETLEQHLVNVKIYQKSLK